MYSIAETIEIHRSPETVFAFLTDVEARIRLNPACEVIGFYKLSPDMDGTPRFRFFFLVNGKRFKSEIVEFVQKGKIISRAVDGKLQVTLSVTPTANGTRLLHEEEFYLPDEVLDPEPEPVVSQAFISRMIRRVLQLLVGPDFHDIERSGKADALIADMRRALQSWLLRIKQTIEAEPSGNKAVDGAV